MNQNKRLDYLIDYLINERNGSKNAASRNIDTIEEKIIAFRGLCNTRPPKPVSEQFIKVQDIFLKQWNNTRQTTQLRDLNPAQAQLYLWQGDITSISTDAIVNAANSTLLGCTRANHNCIDNIIHTRAGVQLRLACHEQMRVQNFKEPMGKAKITKAYNLPANYVIHTVGPFIGPRGVTPLKKQLLESSYYSSLTLADKYQLQSIAFCCISTGEFQFPKQRAAEIAVQTVKSYIKNTQTKLHVVFNVFKEEDLHIYQSLLTKDA